MGRSYLRTAWRNLLRHKTFSVINILGLSIGLAACLLIFLYVREELSYDNYHPQADRIVRVTATLHTPQSDLNMAIGPDRLAGALSSQFPGVKAAVRIQPAEVIVRRNGEVFTEENFLYSEQSVFLIFSFRFLQGPAANALAKPSSIVLTQRAVHKYFGNGEAIGRTLNCDGQEYTVKAVIADRPPNSDLPIDALLYKDFSKTTEWMDDFGVYTFALFRQKPDLKQFEGQLAQLASREIQPELDKVGAAGYHVRFEAEALSDVHFSKGKVHDTPKANRQFNAIFSGLAVFLLLIALLNYINLSTAKATDRAKEVGVRKVIGARPVQLMRQFLGESFFLLTLAWLASIGLVAAGIPLLNRSLGTHLSLAGSGNFLFLAALFVLTGVLSGLYPALVLSRFNPLQTLKGVPVGTAKGLGLRRLILLAQFIIALVMIAGTVVIYSQMHYIDRTNTGVNRAQIACLNIPGGPDSVTRAPAMAYGQAIAKETGVQGLSVGSGLPAEGIMMGSTKAYSGAQQKELFCNYFFIDPRFLPLLQIPLSAGRNLSDSIVADRQQGFLVNEAFVRFMGWKTAVGQPLEAYDRKGRVVGVVKDFFYRSLHNAIEPVVLLYTDLPPHAILVKITPAMLPRLKQTWKTYFPGQPFNYYFLEDNFEAQYKADRMTMVLFNAFTGLAIFISCLGLYGLVSLIIVRRTKEIGIRKVLGASVTYLVTLLAKDFVKLIGWASLIALPLAAIGLNRWLGTAYAYHISVTAWMLAAPVALLLVITLGVTGYRIIRAARANPVNSLRAE